MFYSSAPPRAGRAVGQGRGTHQQPPALPLAMLVPPSSSPVPWVPPALSFLVPGHWHLLQGSLILVPVCRLPQTSVTSTHLRLLSSLCQSIYLNVSLILHLQLWGRIKFTEKQKMQFTAKSIKPSNPEKIRAEIPCSTLCPFKFFLVALFISLLLM